MFLIIDIHRSSPSLPQLSHPMHQAARSGAGSPVFTASGPAHPHVLIPTGLALMFCPGEGQGLLFQLLLLVRCRASSFILIPLRPSLLLSVGGKGWGTYFPYPYHHMAYGGEEGAALLFLHPQERLTCTPYPSLQQGSSSVLPWQGSGPIVPCVAADEDHGHLLHSHDPQTSSFAWHILQRTRWEGQLSLSHATTWQTKWGVISSQALIPSRLAYLCSCQDAQFYCASGEGLEVLLPESGSTNSPNSFTCYRQ